MKPLNAEGKMPPLKIENAKIIYLNFAGRAKTYNAKGYRNFHVVLDERTAQLLEADGWNIRWNKPREEGEPKWPSLKVSVRFDNYPPRVVLVAGEKQVDLDENTVGILDDAEIKNVDLIVTPSRWTNAKKETGIKAYLKKGFFTLSPNDLEVKYMTSRPTANISSEPEGD